MPPTGCNGWPRRPAPCRPGARSFPGYLNGWRAAGKLRMPSAYRQSGVRHVFNTLKQPAPRNAKGRLFLRMEKAAKFRGLEKGLPPSRPNAQKMKSRRCPRASGTASVHAFWAGCADGLPGEQQHPVILAATAVRRREGKFLRGSDRPKAAFSPGDGIKPPAAGALGQQRGVYR